MINVLSPIELLYQALGIAQKIRNQELRIIYLKDVWGLKQADVAKIEKVSQPIISAKYQKAIRKYGSDSQTIRNLTALQFSKNEIKYLQSLPREVISDPQLTSFVQDVLKLYVDHLFFSGAPFKPNTRIAALASLGVQVKHLVKLFKKTQPHISMSIKREGGNPLRLKNDSRYNFDMEIEVQPIIYDTPQNKFFVAGN